MLRRLFTLLAALSLLTGATTSVLWARSYARSEKLTWRTERAHHSLRSAPGHLVLGIHTWYGPGRGPLTGKPGPTYERDQPAPATMELTTIFLLCYDRTARTVFWERLGFVWSQRSSSRDLIITAVAPFWSLTLATALAPFGWTTLRLASRLRRRQGRSGLCPACGYDLRATPARCPECGTFPDRVSRTS